MIRSDSLNYRSLLFIPAIEKYLTKTEPVLSDAIIFDLEDSIPEDQKLLALQMLTTYLKQHTVKNDIFVRVNHHSANNEISAICQEDIQGFVIPKVESSSDIRKFETIINDKTVIALIESPMGIVNLREIAACSIVHALAFGAEDYRSYYNHDIGECGLMYAKSKLTTLANAYNKPVFDSISLEYKDMESLGAEVQNSILYGFSGKLAIHPNQIDVINKMFSEVDYEHYEYIVRQFEAANQGLLVLDGQVYEKPHIDMYKRRLEQKKHL